ncbi:MAG: type II toxin-antitoxin system VapC family toxin [Geminicoccaceae bacterium]
MKLLLDTHALLWWVFDDPQLSRTAHAALSDPDNGVFVSAVSIWEIAIKVSLNKLPLPLEIDQQLPHVIAATGFTALPVTPEHAYGVRHLPWHHRDPFDRLLVSQARNDDLVMLTNDVLIRRYEVQALW